MSAEKTVTETYVIDACTRAGLTPPSGTLATKVLDGGRTGAEVIQLTMGDSSFVLKSIPKASWRGPGMGRADSGEPNLWSHSIMGRVPESIVWPVLDLTDSPEGDHRWMLMRDVSSGIRDRGKFSWADTQTLFEGLAQMHAEFYDDPIVEAAPLPSTGGTTRLFSIPFAAMAGSTTPSEEWVEPFLQGFQVMGAFAPIFFEVLGPKLADDFVALVADEGWKKRMDGLPRTFLHGDLRRANIAFDGDTVQLFDWELSCSGPPGCDLQWHCFLHYWGYPPDGMHKGEDCDDLRDTHLTRLTQLMGDRLDPADFELGWKLGWIRVMAQLGYVLVDPLYPNGGSPEVREETTTLCRRAAERALGFAQEI